MIAVSDCTDWLPTIADNSCDSCVTDPPYELGFMGKAWDRQGIAYNIPMWEQICRVLKPGAFLLSFGGTRTYHRMVCAIEDAGFEIRDTIAWVYGSGFPKSLDVSKALDGVLGKQGKGLVSAGDDGRKAEFKQDLSKRSDYGYRFMPKSEDAQRWQGWGTALKPAMELICVARKPLAEKTVAANVLKWGTGAINVDGCRIPANGEKVGGNGYWGMSEGKGWNPNNVPYKTEDRQRTDMGRWPANLCLDEEAAAEMDAVVGERTSGSGNIRRSSSRGMYGTAQAGTEEISYGDSGGPSRFFYCAKASRSEREAGLEEFDIRHDVGTMKGDADGSLLTGSGNPRNTTARNHHPTVKPISLMRWLVRLVTPPGGIVLEPFAGSGTTCIAAKLEGFDFLACEREAEYAAIAEARVKHWTPEVKQLALTV